MSAAGKVAHTPGPWEYSGGGIWGKSAFNARVRLADITFHNSINAIDSEANARLIAAAPDLLAAAKAMVEIDDRDALTDPDKAATDEYRAEVWANLRAALAKATGA